MVGMWRRLALLCFGVMPLASACVEHAVGPARTADDFERKARTTASDAISTVETVRLLAETSSAGRSFGTFTSVALSEQEDALASIRSDFESIQPPGPDSDSIRAELIPLLDSAVDHIATVRIAARRGALGDLERVGAPLADDSAALNDFLEELSS
jgi:hypothetical protein